MNDLDEVQVVDGVVTVGAEGTEAVALRTITLNRPRKANALTAAMMDSLARAIAPASDGQAAQICVLRSASNRLFCAGADIAEFVSGADTLARQEHALLSLIGQLAASTVPLVVVARGKASGAGALLLALADVVLAADDLDLACPEIEFGMFPVLVDAVLRTRVSPALAARMCLGQSMNATEAWQAGFLTEVLPAQEFDVLVEQRLGYYLTRAAGLGVARRSRLLHTPAAALMAEVNRAAPLMGENFAGNGVRERISAYLARLGRAAAR